MTAQDNRLNKEDNSLEAKPRLRIIQSRFITISSFEFELIECSNLRFSSLEFGFIKAPTLKLENCILLHFVILNLGVAYKIFQLSKQTA